MQSGPEVRARLAVNPPIFAAGEPVVLIAFGLNVVKDVLTSSLPESDPQMLSKSDPDNVQLGKTTVNWKQRTSRFQHLVLAIEFSPVFALCSAHFANGAQMEHTPTEQANASLFINMKYH